MYNVEMALMVDQMVLNLISRQRDEAPAKVDLLEKALRKVTVGKIKVARIIQYCDNPHTSPRSRTIIQLGINK